MNNWRLTNGRDVNSNAVYDLYCGDNVVLSGTGYMIAMQHVLDNGDGADTYQEDRMVASETVAQLRKQNDEMDRRFNS